MAKTNLQGPFTLNDTTIDEVVTNTSPGTYVLGYTKTSGTFIVEYVGRSDDDINDRLHDWVGDYRQFKASYFDTAQEAFEKECAIYHDFGGNDVLDNKIHPDRPVNTSWECSRCHIYG